MIFVRQGNLFDSRAQTLVNAVNCVGIMGKGIAAAFKKKFPAMFADYAARCKRGELKLGEPYLFRDPSGICILNFPTKGHWRSSSRLIDIETGLAHVVANYQALGITSIAFPALGCGAGGLEWADVQALMEAILRDLEIPVEIYAPA